MKKHVLYMDGRRCGVFDGDVNLAVSQQNPYYKPLAIFHVVVNQAGEVELRVLEGTVRIVESTWSDH